MVDLYLQHGMVGGFYTIAQNFKKHCGMIMTEQISV